MNYQHHNFAPYFTHRSEILQNTIARCTARQIASFFAACKEFYAGVFRCLSFGCDVATSGIYQIGPRTRDDTTSPVSSMRACGSSFGRFSLPMQVSSSFCFPLAIRSIVNDERTTVSYRRDECQHLAQAELDSLAKHMRDLGHGVQRDRRVRGIEQSLKAAAAGP